jgi:hypothetical protein
MIKKVTKMLSIKRFDQLVVCLLIFLWLFWSGSRLMMTTPNMVQAAGEQDPNCIKCKSLIKFKSENGTTLTYCKNKDSVNDNYLVLTNSNANGTKCDTTTREGQLIMCSQNITGKYNDNNDKSGEEDVNCNNYKDYADLNKVFVSNPERRLIDSAAGKMTDAQLCALIKGGTTPLSGVSNVGDLQNVGTGTEGLQQVFWLSLNGGRGEDFTGCYAPADSMLTLYSDTQQSKRCEDIGGGQCVETCRSDNPEVGVYAENDNFWVRYYVKSGIAGLLCTTVRYGVSLDGLCQTGEICLSGNGGMQSQDVCNMLGYGASVYDASSVLPDGKKWVNLTKKDRTNVSDK